MNYNCIELFIGIDLNDSFVLNWSLKDNILKFEIEASIWLESEYYSEPINGDYTCYRKASLIFKNIQRITGLKPIESVSSTTDQDGIKDYGNIDTLNQTENGFHISGGFGSVNIIGGEIHFEIYT